MAWLDFSMHHLGGFGLLFLGFRLDLAWLWLDLDLDLDLLGLQLIVAYDCSLWLGLSLT